MTVGGDVPSNQSLGIADDVYDIPQISIKPPEPTDPMSNSYVKYGAFITTRTGERARYVTSCYNTATIFLRSLGPIPVFALPDLKTI